jgi:[acyl-carrier-protein] S-malonyltransferase
MVFPGQGSQSVGMLAELAAVYPTVSETFQEASDTLGLDLWRLAQQGPEADLNKTQNTQPAMLAAGVAAWRVWQQQGGATPLIMAGHSLGEYSALVAANAMGFAEAVSLVAERGRLMQQAVAEGQGAMAAILGLDDDQVRQVCMAAADGKVCEAVNFNSPGQVVVAGDREAVERATVLAKEAGAKRALLLPVSVPSHCSLMETAAKRLADRLSAVTITKPTLAVIHNVNVETTTAANEIRGLLAAQLHQPVRWVETVQKMKGMGVDILLEAGPGKVLTGLTKRIDKTMKGLALFDPAGLDAAMKEISDAE